MQPNISCVFNVLTLPPLAWFMACLSQYKEVFQTQILLHQSVSVESERYRHKNTARLIVSRLFSYPNCGFLSSFNPTKRIQTKTTMSRKLQYSFSKYSRLLFTCFYLSLNWQTLKNEKKSFKKFWKSCCHIAGVSEGIRGFLGFMPSWLNALFEGLWGMVIEPHECSITPLSLLLEDAWVCRITRATS